MKRSIVLPILFGLAGAMVLVSLGLWQLQRHEWKQGVLADIEARIDGDPATVPAEPDAETHRYAPVSAAGIFRGGDLRVLVSSKDTGAAYRLISAFEIEDGRRVLVDRGLLSVDIAAFPLDGERATVVGNLHWPDEIDRFTPAPDLDANIWFARDVGAMAEALGTRPILIVARNIEGVEIASDLLPVGTEGIPDNHFGYAVQWFGLAVVWLGMTVFLLWRIRRRTN